MSLIILSFSATFQLDGYFNDTEFLHDRRKKLKLMLFKYEKS